MKKLVIFLVVLLSLAVSASSKGRCTINMNGSKELSSPVFRALNITFLGIDYSQVRLIGDHGHGAGTNMDPTEIRDKYFNAINELIFNEKKKYDFEKATGESKITYDFKGVTDINLTADPSVMRNFSEHTPLNIYKLREMVKKYKFTTPPNTIGMVFIADKMDRVEAEAFYYVVFFNTSNRDILFYSYVKGKPKGMGYRNYWAGAIYAITKDMARADWKYWENAVMN